MQSHRGYGDLSPVNVVCCTGRRVDPSTKGVLPKVYVSLSVIRWNNKPLDLLE